MNPIPVLIARIRRNALPTLVAATIGVVVQAAPTPLAAAADAPSVATPSFVVRDVRVFDGTHTITATDVVVRDGRIAAIARGATADGLPVVDGRGKTLLPGLVDAHTHTCGDG